MSAIPRLIRIVGSFAAVAVTAFSLAAQTPRRFSVADIARVVRVSDPQLSPDGHAVALVIARADTAKNSWVYELALVDVATGTRRTLSRNRQHVGTPRWSPNGDRLAFTASVKTGDDDVPQVFVMPMAGGDAHQITTVSTGVQQYAWRPDGRDIAFVASEESTDGRHDLTVLWCGVIQAVLGVYVYIERFSVHG